MERQSHSVAPPAGGAAGLEIIPRPLGGSRLARDYLAGVPEALAFFAGSPFHLQGYREAAQRLQARFDRPARERAAAALRPASDAARERLARWVEQGGAVVTTGQQAGLFTGPLYTIYKIVTAIRLAQELEAALGILVLPVFWVASEDHDWDEVNHLHVVDRDDRLRRIALPSADPRHLPMSHRTLGDGVESTLAELRQALGTEGVDWIQLDGVEAAYRPGASVAGAFSEAIARLFAPFGLCLVDAADPALKAASLPVLAGELHGAAGHEQLLRGQTERLTRAGYHAQVTVLPGGANLFLLTDAGRERLYHGADEWWTHDTRAAHRVDELRALLHAEPGRFSPNVLLRPVVESAVFPSLAYVAGPGEIAYFAQLRPLFEAFGVGMPRVYPRAAFTLLAPRVQRLLRALGVGEAELLGPREPLVARLVQEELPPAVRAALDALRREVTRGFDALFDSAAAVDATLGGRLAARRNRVLVELAEAEHAALAAVKRISGEKLRRLERAAAHVAPLGQPQERVLGFPQYAAVAGGELLPALLQKVDVRWAAH